MERKSSDDEDDMSTTSKKYAFHYERSDIDKSQTETKSSQGELCSSDQFSHRHDMRARLHRRIDRENRLYKQHTGSYSLKRSQSK